MYGHVIVRGQKKSLLTSNLPLDMQEFSVHPYQVLLVQKELQIGTENVKNTKPLRRR
jgi:hypothetical protein